MELADLHTHSLLSDGAYVPHELARRALVRGYAVLAVTDHVDAANIDRVVPEIVAGAAAWNRAATGLLLVPGAELTHVPPPLIAELAGRARALGARLVLVHGETVAEPVAPGTNRAAIEAGVDLLAHPGLISPADCRRAAAAGVALELSARRGHCLTNGRLVALWRRCGGTLCLNTDGHESADLFSETMYRAAGRGAGLTGVELAAVRAGSVALARRCSR